MGARAERLRRVPGAEVINSTEGFTEKVLDIAEVARDHGGLVAYRYIRDQRRTAADY